MTGLIFKDPNTMKEDTKHLILIQNLWGSFVAIPFFLVVRDKPAIAPSSVAAQKKSRARLIPSFRKALRDRNYVYLLIIFALIDGEFISFSSVMSLLFDYYNTPTQIVYSSSLISLYGGATAIFGVAASMVAGFLLQKTHKYLWTMRAVCLGVAISGLMAVFTIPAE
jgi:MFS-type transporter involved in bile tolerance (Atg22 family)